jgi:hypothetical protein
MYLATANSGLTLAMTGMQKQSEAALLHVRVDGVVMHQFVMSYFCFNDFLTNSVSKTRPATSGFSLNSIVVIWIGHTGSYEDHAPLLGK